MSTAACSFDTHEMFNQSPPYEDIDLYSSDLPLQEAVQANGAGDEAAALVRLRAAMGHGRDVRARRAAPTRIRRSSTPSTRRASAATWSSSIRPITISCGRASQPACMPRPGRAAGKRAAPPAEVARAARYYMAAQVESGHLCPITMTRAALGGACRRAGAACPGGAESGRDELRPGVSGPWREKPGMTLGMGMTEKQGGTDVRANTTSADRRLGRFLRRHRAQMVSLRADVRRLPGAGAGAGRAHLLLRAALSARRLGQCAAPAAAQGQARQPLQCFERSRVRRRLRLARRRGRRRRPHHHPDGAADAARLRARLGGLHAHGAGAGRAPLPPSLGVPAAPLRPADDARGAGRSGARGRRRGGAGHAACARLRSAPRAIRAKPPMRAWSRRRRSTGSARPRRASSTRPWSASAATATSRKACCRGSIARRRSTRSGKAPATSCASTCCARCSRDEEAAELLRIARARGFAAFRRDEKRRSIARTHSQARPRRASTVGRLATLAAAAALKATAPAAVAEAFVRTRLARQHGALYGADGIDAATAELLLQRALPGA